MTDFEYMKEALMSDIVMQLIQNTDMGLKEAFDYVYNSETYDKLSNPASGLYFQSSGYLFSYLMTEFTTGKMG